VSSGVTPAPVIAGIWDVPVLAITHKNRISAFSNSGRFREEPNCFIMSLITINTNEIIIFYGIIR
jgi:hypothetical protein